MTHRLVAVGALVVILTAGCSDDADSDDTAPAADAGVASSADGGDDGDATTPGDDTDEVAGSDDGDDPAGGDDADGDTSDEPTDGDDDTEAGDGQTDGDETEPTTTTTEVAPEPEPDGEGFDIDREFSPDSEAESLGPIGTTETTLPTEEGEISVGGGEVPDLGDEFPLPDGFELQLSTEIEGEIGFSGRIDGDLADLVAFYDDALPTAGYEIVERQDVPGVLSVLELEGPLDGDVVISQEPGVVGGWTIIVTLAEG